jgi:lipoyl(octanoyl) transferase
MVRVKMLNYHHGEMYVTARNCFRCPSEMSTIAFNDRGPPLRVLQAYLLGNIPLEAILHLQRRLVYDVSGDRLTGYLILCEHSPQLSIGRQGSIAHVRIEPEELRRRRWDLRWVNRGGGCMLHLPGQVSGYAILALDALSINISEYLFRLHEMIRGIFLECDIRAEVKSNLDGVWIGDRRVAHVGIAVREWVSYFGFTINVDPDLELFRDIDCDGDRRPMTSLERERRSHVRITSIRQKAMEAFGERFLFDRISVFHHHPALNYRTTTHAVSSGSRESA